MKRRAFSAWVVSLVATAGLSHSGLKRLGSKEQLLQAEPLPGAPIYGRSPMEPFMKEIRLSQDQMKKAIALMDKESLY